MKREIKFRVWNGIEMIYDVTTGKFGTFYVNPEKGDGLNPNDTASLTGNTTIYPENTPLMQFTGLKDKNGVEIYDGDIILYDFYHDRGQSGFTTTDHKRTITFEYPLSFSSDVSNIKVIGNIYADPELLKAAN